MVKIYTREGDFYEVDKDIISRLSPTLFDSIEISKHTIALDISNEMMDVFFFWLRTRSFQTGPQVMETLTVPHLLADVVDNGDGDGLLGHSDNVGAAGKIWGYGQLLGLYTFATKYDVRAFRQVVTNTWMSQVATTGAMEAYDSALITHAAKVLPRECSLIRYLVHLSAVVWNKHCNKRGFQIATDPTNMPNGFGQAVRDEVIRLTGLRGDDAELNALRDWCDYHEHEIDEERSACGEATRLREKLMSRDSGHKEGNHSAHDQGETEGEEQTKGRIQGSSGTSVNSTSPDPNREASRGEQGVIGSPNTTHDLESQDEARLGDSRSAGQAHPFMALSTGLSQNFRTPPYAESDVAHSLAGLQTRHEEGGDKVFLDDTTANHPAPLPTPPREAAEGSLGIDYSGHESTASVLTPSGSSDNDDEKSEDGDEGSDEDSDDEDGLGDEDAHSAELEEILALYADADPILKQNFVREWMADKQEAAGPAKAYWPDWLRGEEDDVMDEDDLPPQVSQERKRKEPASSSASQAGSSRRRVR